MVDNNSERLYKFEFNYGRGYHGEGIFKATPQQVKALIGKELYFGEICGKHSEVSVVISEKMITEVDLLNLDSLCFGINPVEYAQEALGIDYIITPKGDKFTGDDFAGWYGISEYLQECIGGYDEFFPFKEGEKIKLPAGEEVTWWGQLNYTEDFENYIVFSEEPPQ